MTAFRLENNNNHNVHFKPSSLLNNRAEATTSYIMTGFAQEGAKDADFQIFVFESL